MTIKKDKNFLKKEEEKKKYGKNEEWIQKITDEIFPFLDI